MTPRDVRRRYSKGRVLEVVFKKGYKKRGICAVIFWAASVGGDDAEWRDGGKYHSKRVVLSRGGMRRTGGARGHCKRGWTHVLSSSAGRALGIQTQSPGGELA